MKRGGGQNKIIDSKRSRSSKDLHDDKEASAMSADERQQLRALLFSRHGGAKSSLARSLIELQKAGMLNDDKLGASYRDERRALQLASEKHAKAVTPYGTVVQHLDLGSHLPLWDYVHPFAFLYHLSSLSQPFAEMLASMIDSAPHGLRLVLYGDEMTPGNPLRTDKGRQLWNFYYCFLEMPNWLLHRKDGWLVFGALRTTVLSNVSGTVSALVVKLLKILFVNGPANFTRGFFIMCNGDRKLLRANFAGFLADEKGLKEFMSLKGASGNKPCIACKNVLNLQRKEIRADATYSVGVDCDDFAKLKGHTNETVMSMIDRLSGAKGTVSPEEFQEMEMLYGVNYDPQGLLFDPALRAVVKPIDHYIRDWQHTLVSNGVACNEIRVNYSHLIRSKLERLSKAATLGVIK